MARCCQSGDAEASCGGIAVGAALLALSLLYTLFFGAYGGVQWFLWVPIVLNAALAVGLGWVATKQT